MEKVQPNVYAANRACAEYLLSTYPSSINTKGFLAQIESDSNLFVMYTKKGIEVRLVKSKIKYIPLSPEIENSLMQMPDEKESLDALLEETSETVH